MRSNDDYLAQIDHLIKHEFKTASRFCSMFNDFIADNPGIYTITTKLHNGVLSELRRKIRPSLPDSIKDFVDHQVFTLYSEFNSLSIVDTVDSPLEYKKMVTDLKKNRLEVAEEACNTLLLEDTLPLNFQVRCNAILGYLNILNEKFEIAYSYFSRAHEYKIDDDSLKAKVDLNLLNCERELETRKWMLGEINADQYKDSLRKVLRLQLASFEKLHGRLSNHEKILLHKHILRISSMLDDEGKFEHYWKKVLQFRNSYTTELTLTCELCTWINNSNGQELNNARSYRVVKKALSTIIELCKAGEKNA